MSNDDWQSQKFRQNVISKINEMLQANGQDPSKNAGVMENHIFKKSRTKDEYLGLVAKLFVHFKELGRAKQQPPPQNPEMNHQGMMQDPLNALQNLASQGNRNPQMMSMSAGPNSNQMGGPVPASNLLQTLNQHRPGQQQIQQMHTIRGQMAMNAGGPGNQMVNQINNMQMMAGNAGAGGPVAQSMGGMPGQMNAGGVAGGPQVVGPGLPNAVSNQIHLQNSGPMNVNNMNVQQMQQMNQNQMMNMNHPQLSQMMNARLNQANAGPGGNAVGGSMQQNQNGGPGAMHPNGPSVAGAGNAQVAQAGNLSQMLNMPHKANMQGAGGGQMFAGNRTVAGQQQFLRQSASPVNSQQQQQQLQQQLQQQVQQQQQQQAPQQVQQQSQPRSQTPQQGPGTPQQQQQPQQSPVQQQQQAPQAQQNQAAQQQAAQAQQSSNSQMIPSPAMGPTPSPQMQSQHIMQGNQRNMSHPSPGGPANNAGGGQMNANSPFNPNEEHLYREKYKQLTKYIEPLKHMLDRDRTNSDKMAKMNKLLEILSNPTHRVPLETLLKCEKALEKMELSQIIDTRPSPASGPSSAAGAAQSPAQVPSPAQPTSAAATAAMSTIAIGKSANPLLEVVTTTMQSPLANHTLYRTFRPALDVLFGSDIVAPKKLRTTPPPDEAETNELKVPYALQGEVARLDTKFKVKLDQSVKHDTKSIRLNCSLDDKRLPSVPPVQINISEEYPMVSPGFSMPTNDYGVTPFLKKVQSALMARITKLPKRHSLTHLLDCWEMSVRQACSPDAKPAFFDLSAIYGV